MIKTVKLFKGEEYVIVNAGSEANTKWKGKGYAEQTESIPEEPPIDNDQGDNGSGSSGNSENEDPDEEDDVNKRNYEE